MRMDDGSVHQEQLVGTVKPTEVDGIWQIHHGSVHITIKVSILHERYRHELSDEIHLSVSLQTVEARGRALHLSHGHRLLVNPQLSHDTVSRMPWI